MWIFFIRDWNAKVGSQETPGVTGKFGVGVQNEAGQRLIGFCQEKTLVIANTLFQQHKTLHMDITDGQHWNQIDYILCRQRWRSSIQSAKARPGADYGSDHEFLIAKFRLKLKKVEKTTRPFRYDLNHRGWGGWMASLTQWTWVWVDSRSWWWTGRPNVLRFMGSQRVGHDWATELNWIWICLPCMQFFCQNCHLRAYRMSYLSLWCFTRYCFSDT